MININTFQVIFMLGILDVLRWSLRKSPRDVVAMYNALSPLMCHAAQTSMLNFGYWDAVHDTPALAQKKMCDVVASMADFDSIKNGLVLDVGSGLGAPAAYWRRRYPSLGIHCVNTSYVQLYESEKRHVCGCSLFCNCTCDACGIHNGSTSKSADAGSVCCSCNCNCSDDDDNNNSNGGGDDDNNDDTDSMRICRCTCTGSCSPLSGINASATLLPFAGSTADCVVSLESAQHFTPLEKFILECRRVLTSRGTVAMAIPVVLGRLASVKLGLLNFTWASEHYNLKHVCGVIRDAGFEIASQQLVGGSVYAPLAEYYRSNRADVRRLVSHLQYPSYIEPMIAASMESMRRASDSGLIEYALLKCRLH